MSVIFSPTTVAFYPVELQADYVAAGSWPADGVEISDQVWETFKGSPPDGKIRGAVDGAPAWVDAPPPSPQPIITATAFLNRFTQVELGMLAANPTTVLLLITCAAAGRIDLSDPAVQAGINGLVPAGVLSAERATQILAVQ